MRRRQVRGEQEQILPVRLRLNFDFHSQNLLQDLVSIWEFETFDLWSQIEDRDFEKFCVNIET